MSAKVFSAANIGLTSHLIEVEADISSSTTSFFIVGLPDAAVTEAKERVRSAIKNCDLPFPRTKVTVNLAPADIKKVGPSFDLPIAVAILAAKKLIKLELADQQSLFIGELSLDGSLRPVSGILPIAATAEKLKIKRLYLSFLNAKEAGLIEGLEIFPVKHLRQLIDHLKGDRQIAKFKKTPLEAPAEQNKTIIDLTHIKGQEQVKRALVIAAAGYHNLLMIGPPGSGKTLLAKGLRDLLPPLSFEESLEVTKIYSLAGLLPLSQPLITARPFRSPHHTSSGIALVGGGSFPRPGEITLAHRGVLFLDELPEFPRGVLENLRQPLEDGLITVSRASTTVQFPARFTLIATANPCPCGYATDLEKPCRCSPLQIQKYQKRISGPLLDRIDLQVAVPRLNIQELTSRKTTATALNFSEKIKMAQERQGKRFKNLPWLYNSEIDYKKIEEFCQLDAESEQLLKTAIIKFQLSARSYHKILKISRTIADLENSENIKLQHVAEALQYRQNILQ